MATGQATGHRIPLTDRLTIATTTGGLDAVRLPSSGVQDDEFHSRLTGLDDDEFERLYGPLARLRPDAVAGLLDGMDAPWWIVGGWAIEAFTGERRDHDDVDVCILECDAPSLIAHFLGTHHVWVTGGGTLRPVLSATQRLPRWMHQIWVRENATEPWLLDVIVTPDRDGRWVFRRDPAVVLDLERVTWIAGDGLLYQRPEIILAFKAALNRPKDRSDLEAALPRLDVASRSWLADTIDRIHPSHPWLERVRT